MKTRKIFDMKAFDMKDYYFIIHLLDRVLVGSTKECPHEDLFGKISLNTLLEAHFFNDEKEIYAVRYQSKLLYETLEHDRVQEDMVINRSYQLEEKFKNQAGKDSYDILEVKEYIDHDEDNLAYVKKTVLYRLKKEGG